jgi:hypothetical protein
MNSKRFWVPGIPATFATKGEVPWKNALESSIPAPSVGEFNGVKLRFVLPTLAPNNQPLDIDNLCEPVFSVLINKLGWFGGSRQNLKWWHAVKVCGQPSGLQLSIEATVPPELMDKYGSPFFAGTFVGVLPSKATDPQIPSWLASLKKFGSPKKNDRFVIRLQFGGGELNIGDIATGRVKSLIDCLYPIIGGSKGKPEDWRVDVLQVEKGVTNLRSGSVKISIWKI